MSWSGERNLDFFLTFVIKPVDFYSKSVVSVPLILERLKPSGAIYLLFHLFQHELGPSLSIPFSLILERNLSRA